LGGGGTAPRSPEALLLFGLGCAYAESIFSGCLPDKNVYIWLSVNALSCHQVIK
jgi:hypothetical protein